MKYLLGGTTNDLDIEGQQFAEPLTSDAADPTAEPVGGVVSGAEESAASTIGPSSVPIPPKPPTAPDVKKNWGLLDDVLLTQSDSGGSTIKGRTKSTSSSIPPQQ